MPCLIAALARVGGKNSLNSTFIGACSGFCMAEASPRASASLKLPVISARPPAIGPLKVGAEMISPSRTMAKGMALRPSFSELLAVLSSKNLSAPSFLSASRIFHLLSSLPA